MGKKAKTEAKLTWWGYPITIATPDLIWPWLHDIVVKRGTYIKLENGSWEKASLLEEPGLELGTQAVNAVRLQGKRKIKELKQRKGFK
ncbi:MAG: hypothetical protein GY786_03515 [Proteobacteria bacterium]|nr:hypothetical protein [Pseudomonadota bacterium]